ncbi:MULTISPECIES: DUF2325 domain-containing protein [Clostridium]|jgi:hypothetical protein|uniref:DUF2325 domain-containing protein n=1 Tax=bioreactor metagenome TaxID=1076179 RepID=A0A644WXF9_9ZZZZ|nr:DUF2325 domain-containing protein [Clostridium sp. C8]KLE14668.1 hypothetical protein AAT22_15480 [Clostridium sp. C8]
MSIVVVGGHDRMSREYLDVCKKYNCKAKIFTQMKAGLNDKIGNPDVIILFTNVVSHKMVRKAKKEADRKNIKIINNHNSTVHSLEEIIRNII